MSKLDLMNNRSPIVSQQRLFDSCDYVDLSRSEKHMFTKGNINFDSQSIRRDMIDRNKSQKLDSVDKPYKIRGVFEFKQEKPPIESYYAGNIPAQKFYCKRDRISTPTMNKVLDRDHDIPNIGIIERIEAGKVAGGNWSKSTTERKDLAVLTTTIGPGHYDVEAMCTPSRTVKFSDIDTKRAELEFLEAPSSTSYTPNYDFNRPRTSIGAVPFTTSSRFNAAIYRKPGYVTTSGMALSPDFDRKLGWEKPDIPVTLECRGPRLRPPPEINTANDVIPDYGQKITIKTEVLTGNKKYAMCFR